MANVRPPNEMYFPLAKARGPENDKEPLATKGVMRRRKGLSQPYPDNRSRGKKRQTNNPLANGSEKWPAETNEKGQARRGRGWRERREN